jgi:acyl carrier protein
MELQCLTQQLVDFFKENSSNTKCENICAESRLKEDLELDSLDTVELIMKLEDEHCIKIPDDEANKLVTIGDVAVLILKLKECS